MILHNVIQCRHKWNHHLYINAAKHKL